MSPESRVMVVDVWQLALPKGTIVLGGESGLGQPVEWVASLRVAYPLFGTLGKGYMALARLELARRLDSNLTPRYLLQELHRARASALVVDELISSEDIALADELGLPVLLVPEGMDMHEIERAILRTLVDREAQVARRESEARTQLQQTLSRGGIPAVADELRRLTDGSVLIKDQTGAVVAQAGADLLEEHCTETSFGISVAGRSLGSLVLRRRLARNNPVDLVYARQSAEICAIEMLQRFTRQEAEERLGADLIELLLEEDRNEDAIVARFARLGYNLSSDQRNIVIAIGSGKGDSAACSDLVRDLEWGARREHINMISTTYRKYVLAFCALAATTAESRVRVWLQQSLGEAAARCSAGVSRVVKDVDGLRSAVYQAIDAWNLGQRITDQSSPYFYEELGLYRLLTGIRARDELARFYDETLGSLLRYDATHGTDLVHTLEVFFEQNANASQTSRALFVHRNTLNYRLQRIVEITGLDLNSAEARLAFQLAIKVHHLTQ